MKKSKTIFLLFSAILVAISSQVTASESSWFRYTAISPDGQTVAFSYKGDIYVVSSTGGEAKILTLDKGLDTQPIWSNDGKSIAFSSNRHGNFDIFVMPSKGGKATRLTFHSSNDWATDFNPEDSAVLFNSVRQDDVKSSLFPYARLGELYQVLLSGGTPFQILTTPAESARYSHDGKNILYQDVKGYEDTWRKHHTSNVTRDIWQLNIKTKKHQKLTQFEGEDRNPIWSNDQKGYYYLSEKSGNFNVWYRDIGANQPNQITFHDKHPVRFLSLAKNGSLVYSYHGNIFVQMSGQKNSQELDIEFNNDDSTMSSLRKIYNDKVSEIAVSPDGKEIAMVIRGEIFVTSSDFLTTKQITHTAEQERTVSFSPDGSKLLYATERGNSWKIYQAEKVNSEEKYFAHSTLIKETSLVATKQESFQPAYSPDGSEVAFLENRTVLKVLNLKSNKVRTVMSADKNYSYSDGDQWYQWSPDGKWFAVDFIDKQRWMGEIGLVDAKGGTPPVNLTNSGYADFNAEWMMEGNVLLYTTAKNGQRSHGSWGSDVDLYGIFLNQESFDKFNLSKEEHELLTSQEKYEKKAKDESEKNSKKENSKKAKSIIVDLKYLDDRTKRLTVNSSNLQNGVLTKNGEKLYYLSQFEKGYDLWVHDFRESSTSVLVKLGAKVASFTLDKDEKNAFVLADGKISKVELEKKSSKPVVFSASIDIDTNAERAYFFEHLWRQVREKFYLEDLHGVDWDFYKKAYAMKLPSINNGHDFAELTSELLGELNASHTGTRFRAKVKNADKTASLGIYRNRNHSGKGLIIAEIIARGPFDSATSKASIGDVIEKINGVVITNKININQLLNNQAGKPTRVSLYSKKTKKRWEETIKPIDLRSLSQLHYKRWTKSRRELTEKLSNGRIGYVHVRGMNDASFREVYSEILGRHSDKEALIVDTRFNGGGWLHDDLVTLLSGKAYMDFVPRGQELGSEPLSKWMKPSIVVMGEGNYSDAHMFPYAYRALNIGELVGMPVAGTGTAVWWETLHDGETTFGIPEVGMRGNDGKWLENQLLVPDHQVSNDPESIALGKDKQIEKSVEVLLKQLNN